ncbi:hypothetical protein BDR26DRAFT_933431 [Obelidium mucronatum]|nr:hypothetical protein BDR26DRAFT_933431 [Obelidium mucronatum]
MRRSTRQRQAAAAASTKHTTAPASPINPISAIRACPAAPAEILAALDQIEQVLLDCSCIYTLPDCNLDLKRLESLLLANPGKILFLPSSSIPADHLTSGEYFPTACYHNDQPHKRSFISGFFDPLEQWELQHAAFSAPIMLCQPIKHYRHSPLHQDYGTAINVLLQSPTNQQLFKLWVVLVPSDPTAIIPTLNPLSFAQAMALEVGPSCTYTARICFVKRPGDLSVIPSGYPHAVITVSTTKDATSIMGGAHVIFPKDYLKSWIQPRHRGQAGTASRRSTDVEYINAGPSNTKPKARIRLNLSKGLYKSKEQMKMESKEQVKMEPVGAGWNHGDDRFGGSPGPTPKAEDDDDEILSYSSSNVGSDRGPDRMVLVDGELMEGLPIVDGELYTPGRYRADF